MAIVEAEYEEVLCANDEVAEEEEEEQDVVAVVDLRPNE